MKALVATLMLLLTSLAHAKAPLIEADFKHYHYEYSKEARLNYCSHLYDEDERDEEGNYPDCDFFEDFATGDAVTLKNNNIGILTVADSAINGEDLAQRLLYKKHFEALNIIKGQLQKNLGRMGILRLIKKVKRKNGDLGHLQMKLRYRLHSNKEGEQVILAHLDFGSRYVETLVLYKEAYRGKKLSDGPRNILKRELKEKLKSYKRDLKCTLGQLSGPLCD